MTRSTTHRASVRVVARVAGGVAIVTSALATVTWGCSSDNAVVGGACATGYAEINGGCQIAGPDASNLDAPYDAADARYDGPASDSSDAADSPYDGFPEDGANGDAADACTPPFDTPQHCGDCFTVCSGVNDACKLVDGGYACVPLCDPPTTECAGQCVNETNDPFNCGGCGIVCASG